MKPKSLRFLILLLTLTLIAAAFPACATVPYTEGQGELKIVASGFIPFDFARNVTGNKATVTVLQTDGGDMHDFNPTTASLAALAEADIFICVGGISDEVWMNDAIKACENKNLTVIKLTELVQGELAETEGHSHSELCEQIHSSGDHDHEHDREHTADDGHGHTMDEHIWTSLRNAIKAVEKIAVVCAEKDSANASAYSENAESYINELELLDAEYTAALSTSQTKTLIFADRFPFIYLTKDYGLCYFAAFSGCSGELDADFETAVRLTEEVKHSGLKYIIVTETSDKKLADNIASATDCTVLMLDSMQSVSRSEIEAGTTYLATMKANLQALKTALV